MKKLNHKVFYLVSQAGFGNLGDELILREWLHKIDNIYGENATVYIDVSQPSICQFMLATCSFSLNIKVQDILWNISRQHPVEAGLSLKNELMPYLENFSKVEIVHILGGGYINDTWEFNKNLITLCKFIQDFCGCKLFATGIGLFPFETQNLKKYRFFINALKKFEFVDVRDEESYKILNNLDTEIIKQQTCDDIFLAEKHRLINNEKLQTNKQKKLCIFLSGGDLVINYTIDLIEFSVNQKKISNVLFVCCTDDDLVQVKKIIVYFNLYKNLNFQIISFFEAFIKPLQLNQDDMFFCTRFHGHLLASLSGATGICASTTPYYDVKHQSLIKLGSGFAMIGMHDNKISDWMFDRTSHENFSLLYNELNNLKEKIFSLIYVDK